MFLALAALAPELIRSATGAGRSRWESLVRRMLIGTMTAAAVLAVAAPAAAAPGTSRVLPADLAANCATGATAAGWCTSTRETGTIGIAAGPADTPSGDAHLRLSTPLSNDKAYAFTAADAGQKIADIDLLGYRSYIEPGTQNAIQAPALNIEIDRNGPGVDGGFATLVWEPHYTGAAITPGTWQQWTPSEGQGGWWSPANGTTSGAAGALGFPTYVAGWADVQAALPDATVFRIGSNQGGGNPGLISFVDLLDVDGTVYDFELQAPDVAPALQLPADLTVTAAGKNGSAVTYTATATDAEDGTLPASCTPASGSVFPLGTTAVTCTATDSAGAMIEGTFDVTVTYDARTLSVTSPARGGTGVAVVRLVGPDGRNISSPSIPLTATVIDGQPIRATRFVFVPFVNTYLTTFETRGLSRGDHTLSYTAGADPLPHELDFRVR